MKREYYKPSPSPSSSDWSTLSRYMQAPTSYHQLPGYHITSVFMVYQLILTLTEQTFRVHLSQLDR